MKRSRPNLFISASPGEAWKEAIGPWLTRIAPDAWKHERPSFVFVPTRSQANALKARLIGEGLSHVGLHFATPTSMRALFTREFSSVQPEPAHLRLLLAIAAGEIEDEPNEPGFFAAKSVARSPGPLLRALDRLTNSGWEFEQLQLPAFTKIVRRFNKLRGKCDFPLPGESDR